MGTCKHISFGKYKCPNNVWHDDKCLLHSSKTIDSNSAQTHEVETAYKGILHSKGMTAVFSDINFPDNFQPTLPQHIGKRIIFYRCVFPKTHIFGNRILNDTIIFWDCKFEDTLNLSYFRLFTNIIIHECNFVKDLKINGIISNCLYLRLSLNKIMNLHIMNTRFDKGIILKDNNITGGFGIENITTFFNSRFKFLPKPSAKPRVINSSFLAKTEIDWGWKYQHLEYPRKNHGILFSDCSIDNLMIRDFSFDLVTIANPYLTLNHTTIIRNYNINKRNSKDVNTIVMYVRKLKEHFRGTEHTEIYDLYYKLEQYYSRFLPTYGRGKKIVNFFYRNFSDYGYSIWKPFLWLIGLLILFNTIYFLIDFNCDSFYACFKEYCCTFAKHIEQMTFYRSEKEWMPSGSSKRIIFIFETIILIPIISCIVISIKKVFRRQ